MGQSEDNRKRRTVKRRYSFRYDYNHKMFIITFLVSVGFLALTINMYHDNTWAFV